MGIHYPEVRPAKVSTAMHQFQLCLRYIGQKQLDSLPLRCYYSSMKVVEKDNAVQGLLKSECQRCRDVLRALSKKAAHYPKGSLNVRKKAYKDRVYSYHYLIARENGQVVNRHISKAEVSELQQQIEQREKCRKEMRVYKRRIAYLEKLLVVPRRRGESKN